MLVASFMAHPAQCSSVSDGAYNDLRLATNPPHASPLFQLPVVHVTTVFVRRKARGMPLATKGDHRTPQLRQQKGRIDDSGNGSNGTGHGVSLGATAYFCLRVVVAPAPRPGIVTVAMDTFVAVPVVVVVVIVAVTVGYMSYLRVWCFAERDVAVCYPSLERRWGGSRA